MSVQAVGSARGGARGGRDVRRRDGGLLDRPGERGRAHRPSTFNGAIEVRMETVSLGGHVTNVSDSSQTQDTKVTIIHYFEIHSYVKFIIFRMYRIYLLVPV